MAKTKIVENPMKDLKPQSWLGKGLYIIGGIGVVSWGYQKVSAMLKPKA